jgi:hypothetical protein
MEKVLSFITKLSKFSVSVFIFHFKEILHYHFKIIMIKKLLNLKIDIFGIMIC